MPCAISWIRACAERAETMAAPLLSVENLSVEIAGPQGPRPILAEVTLQLAAGESLGVVGESGCGKSMLALAIMGLLPKAARTGGRIVFEGESLLSAGETRLCGLRGCRLAIVFQEPMTSLNPVMAIGRQVAEGLLWHQDLPRATAMTAAEKLLARVGLPAARFPLSLFPHQLSGGQRQRVMIAMALACGPSLLIADEPTTALDVTLQRQILDLLLELAEERSMALMLISHDLGVVAETTDRCAVLYAGRVVETAATARLFAAAAHPYTAGLLRAMPQLPRSPEDFDPDAALPTIGGEVPGSDRAFSGCAFAPRCFRVEDRCRSQRPPLISTARGDARACFYPLTAARER